MRRLLAIALAALLLVPLVSADMDGPDVSREATGGHAILMEQFTATWCEVCATVDPWIPEFTADHSNRVVRVALHPNDHDPFGSPLTNDRLALKELEGNQPLPTFWFDGEDPIVGGVTYSQLAKKLKSAEARRDHWVGMQMDWDTWRGDEGERHQLSLMVEDPISENATITIFRLETLTMTTQIANNGIDTHHGVATQMIVLDREGQIVKVQNGTQGWDEVQSQAESFEFSTRGEVDTFVAVIEDSGVVLGVLGISNTDSAEDSDLMPMLTILLLLSALVCSSVILRRGSSD
jgi:hypothetical protein